MAMKTDKHNFDLASFAKKLLEDSRSMPSQDWYKEMYQMKPPIIPTSTGRYTRHVQPYMEIDSSVRSYLRPDGVTGTPISPVLYSGRRSSIQMKQSMEEWDGINPPSTTKQDREYLGMSIPEYNKMAEAVQSGAYLNKAGDICKLRNAKSKKLKNLRHAIRKSAYLLNSMIWKEQLRIIQNEIDKRRGKPHGHRPEQTELSA